MSKSVDWVTFSNAGLIDVVVNEDSARFVMPKLALSAGVLVEIVACVVSLEFIRVSFGIRGGSETDASLFLELLLVVWSKVGSDGPV